MYGDIKEYVPFGRELFLKTERGGRFFDPFAAYLLKELFRIRLIGEYFLCGNRLFFIKSILFLSFSTYIDSMETSFVEIKQKDVVNIKDGKKLGRTTDIIFTYPEGRVMGIIVPGKKGFLFLKSELFIDLRNVVKIGEDTVLVDITCAPKPTKEGRNCREYPSPPSPPPPPPKDNGRRSYEDYE